MILSQTRFLLRKNETNRPRLRTGASPLYATGGPPFLCVESRKLFKLNYGLCGSDDASDIVFTPSETTEAPEESREASRRQLLEGNLDTFPTLQSRVVRIFVTSSFSGII